VIARQRAGSISLIGPREVNEDSLHLVDRSRSAGYVSAFLAVADGMGGMSAGDLASRTTIEALTEAGVPTGGDELVARIASANDRIHVLAGDGASMGTTLTSALVESGEATVAHVGDSRAYLVHQGAISQVTEDHSQVGRLVRDGVLTPLEAMHHPNQNVLERALGAGDSTPDVYRVGVGPGDILFLCTDGLHTFVTPDEMLRELEQNLSLQAACEQLARLAEQRGSDDNITAVAWEYPMPPQVDRNGGSRRVPTRVGMVNDAKAVPSGRHAAPATTALAGPVLAGLVIITYVLGFVLGLFLSAVGT
jgi:protein phosphatase